MKVLVDLSVLGIEIPEKNASPIKIDEIKQAILLALSAQYDEQKLNEGQYLRTLPKDSWCIFGSLAPGILLDEVRNWNKGIVLRARRELTIIQDILERAIQADTADAYQSVIGTGPDIAAADAMDELSNTWHPYANCATCLEKYDGSGYYYFSVALSKEESDRVMNDPANYAIIEASPEG